MSASGDPNDGHVHEREQRPTPDVNENGEDESQPHPAPTNYERFVDSLREALPSAAAPSKPEPILKTYDLEGIADYISRKQPQNVIFLVGAGISTSAGIPDFRTPGTGLYDNLQKYHLEAPELIFDISLFRNNPVPFFDLARGLFLCDAKPTPAHYFMRLLAEKGLVRRIYTQNIDTLEYLAGTNPKQVITAHGSHYSNTCQRCGEKYNQEWIENHLRLSTELVARCSKCKGGVVKPDIVFFGENLPFRFYKHVEEDFDSCDLLIIMGTSLVVHPVAGLVNAVGKNVPRLLLNLEPVGRNMMTYHIPMMNKRDVYHKGTSDEGVRELAELLGWRRELEQMIQHEWRVLDEKIAQNKAQKALLGKKD